MNFLTAASVTEEHPKYHEWTFRAWVLSTVSPVQQIGKSEQLRFFFYNWNPLLSWQYSPEIKVKTFSDSLKLKGLILSIVSF